MKNKIKNTNPIDRNPKIGDKGVFIGEKFYLLSDLDVVNVSDCYPAKVTFKWKGKKRTASGVEITG